MARPAVTPSAFCVWGPQSPQDALEQVARHAGGPERLESPRTDPRSARSLRPRGMEAYYRVEKEMNFLLDFGKSYFLKSPVCH